MLDGEVPCHLPSAEDFLVSQSSHLDVSSTIYRPHELGTCPSPSVPGSSPMKWGIICPANVVRIRGEDTWNSACSAVTFISPVQMSHVLLKSGELCQRKRWSWQPHIWHRPNDPCGSCARLCICLLCLLSLLRSKARQER